MSHGQKATWQIGDLDFMAIKENGGWRVFGTVGMPGLEVCEERYFEWPIDDIMRWTADWALEYAANLLHKAETFSPEEFL